MPPGATQSEYKCPAKGCGHIITAESEAADIATQAELKVNAASMRDLAHRNMHSGTHWLKRKLLHVDHVKRCPSLLHFVLNSTTTTLTTGIKLGANKAQIEAINTVFEVAKVNYAFKTAKGQRDKKAPGNVCRKNLWTKGLLMKVVNARWGAPRTAAERAAE